MYGAFKYPMMPFGLSNAPAAFQRYMNAILENNSPLQLLIYLDNRGFQILKKNLHSWFIFLRKVKYTPFEKKIPRNEKRERRNLIQFPLSLFQGRKIIYKKILKKIRKLQITKIN
jgi:hypothetical protein